MTLAEFLRTWPVGRRVVKIVVGRDEWDAIANDLKPSNGAMYVTGPNGQSAPLHVEGKRGMSFVTVRLGAADVTWNHDAMAKLTHEERAAFEEYADPKMAGCTETKAGMLKVRNGCVMLDEQEVGRVG